jgi:hypothetical protein
MAVTPPDLGELPGTRPTSLIRCQTCKAPHDWSMAAKARAEPSSGKVLIELDELEDWMMAPWVVTKYLLWPLPDGMLKIVARGKSDQPAEVMPGGNMPPRASKSKQGSLL